MHRFTIAFFVLALAVAVPAQADQQCKLIRPGDEPRVKLRYDLEVGDVQVIRMRMKMAMGESTGWDPVELVAIPEVITREELRVVAKLSADRYRVTSETIAVDVRSDDPAMRAIMMEEMRSTIGSKAEIIIDNRGRVDSVRVITDSDPEFTQRLLDIMKQAVLLLPKEPIGKGGSWAIDSKVDFMFGLKLNQIASYQIVTLDSLRNIELNASLTQSLDSKTLKNPPGVTPGTTVSAETWSVVGDGSSLLDLTRPAAKRASMSMKSSFRLLLTNAGRQERMNMKIEIEMMVD